MNKKAIYTALFGNYDNWHEPTHVNHDYDYYLFTDQDIKSDVYKVKKMKGNVQKAREIKIRPHHFLPKYAFTIWHDANIQQIANINSLLKQTDFDITAMQHPHRNCIYTEASECICRGKDSADKIQKQINQYKSENYPENNGLIASGLLFRYNNYYINLFCEYWFLELLNGSIRDQLSFNYALWKMPNLKLQTISFNVLKTHFIHHKHNK